MANSTIVRNPLRVLLMSDDGHGPGSRSDMFMTAIREHRLLTSFGIAIKYKSAKAMLADGQVNTILINPKFGMWAELKERGFGAREEIGAELTTNVGIFIKEIRQRYPWIVFVLYGTPDDYNELVTQYPRFEHYFFLEYQESDTAKLDAVLEACVDWHAGLYQYDIAISFAGEDRADARAIADSLVSRGMKVFFDEYAESDLLGKNLYTHLQQIYSRTARYCVMLVSESYAEKLWTGHERMAAQERAFRQRGAEYIIPVRIDDTPLPGLLSTVGYARMSAGVDALTDLIVNKLWKTDASKPAEVLGSLQYVDDVI